MRLTIWTCLGLMLAAPVAAETQTIPCPIGGAAVEIAPTYDCARTGWTMSLRQTSDCDDLPRLPICPDSGLPVFARYTASEIDALTDYVTTQTYALRRDRPDWVRAVDVADFLDSWGSQDSFILMLNLLWWQPDALLANPALVSRFISEAEVEITRTPEGSETQVFTRAVLAYVLLLSGQSAKGRALLDTVQDTAQGAVQSSDQMRAYLARLAICADQIDDATCRPNAPFVTQ